MGLGEGIGSRYLRNVTVDKQEDKREVSMGDAHSSHLGSKEGRCQSMR